MSPSAATTALILPFTLTDEHLRILQQSEGFSILREHLAIHCQHQFCPAHALEEVKHGCNWILLRDLLHALLVPIVELFDNAARTASLAAGTKDIETIDDAYTGDAGSAFTWLQTFLENERKWCLAQDCPACVVSHVLVSDSFIRLLCAACLLSDIQYPFTLEGPTLPSFIFFLDYLRRTRRKDRNQDRDGFEELNGDALQLRNGIEGLVRQCLSLEATFSGPAAPVAALPPATSLHTPPSLATLKKSQGSRTTRKKQRAKAHDNLDMESNKLTEEREQRARNCVQSRGVAGLAGRRSISSISPDEATKASRVVVQEVPSDLKE